VAENWKANYIVYKYAYVVCTYNGALRLTACLEALMIHLDERTCEIIVVDNASTDGTFELANFVLKKSNIPWKVIFEIQPGLMNARIRGFKESESKILVFIDDDNLIQNRWTYHHDEVFENPLIGICGALPIFRENRVTPIWWRRFCYAYAIGRNGLQDGLLVDREVFGAGMAIRKNVFEKFLNSFYPTLTCGRNGKSLMAGDDTEICLGSRILGYQIWFDSRNVLIHEIDEGRLTEESLQKILAGFAKADPLLKAYRTKVNKITFFRSFGKAVMLYLAFTTLSIIRVGIKRKENRILSIYSKNLVVSWLHAFQHRQVIETRSQACLKILQNHNKLHN
jgi:glycosyltransferase involved in cell wall biosynthesis